MKLVFLFSFIFVIHHFSFSQQTTVVTKKKGSYYEEYSVLAEDKKVKHGSYVMLYTNSISGYAIESIGNYSNNIKDGYWEFYYERINNIKERGFYKNGLRDSLWVGYYPQGGFKKLVEVKTNAGNSFEIQNAHPIEAKVGKYKNGKQVGVWEYFDARGVLYQTYDYDTREVTFLNKELSNNHDSGYIGGEALMYQHLYDTFNMDGLMKTINSKTNLETGVIKFKVQFDQTGRIKNIAAIEQTLKNNKFYVRSMETIQSLADRFYSKKVNGVAQESEKIISFVFDVNSNTTNTSSQNTMSYSMYMKFNLVIKVEN